MVMDESESGRKRIIEALEELQAALEGKLPGDLLPEVADKVSPLRDNVRSLLERLRKEPEEQQD